MYKILMRRPILFSTLGGGVLLTTLSFACTEVVGTGSQACKSDADCKNDRICESGECVDPASSATAVASSSGTGSGCTTTESECSVDSECCSTPQGGGCVQIAVGKFCVAGCAQDSDCKASDCCATLSNGHHVCVLDDFLEPLSQTCVQSACAPASGDSSCTQCIKTDCCPEADACSNDSNCVCYLACLVNGGTLGSCSGQCGAASNVSVNAYTCVTSSCSSCPF